MRQPLLLRIFSFYLRRLLLQRILMRHRLQRHLLRLLRRRLILMPRHQQQIEAISSSYPRQLPPRLMTHLLALLQQPE